MALLPTNVVAGNTSHIANTNQVHTKLNRFVYDVKTDFGASGDGTTDDTTNVQAAIDAANTAGGAVVYFPPGTYDVNNLTWKQNVTYLGVKGVSILTIRTGASYLGSCDSGSSTTFVSNMTFDSLTFRGRIDTDTTFDQQRHLLNLNGVRSVTIQNCEFIGWHGDAIYLGSSNSGGVERHNQRVKILYNRFDGLTKNNRNCISIIDGEDILVQGNSARRFSRNDMPGFVDVEPNSASASFAVARKIKVVGNHTEDHNQNFFQLMLPGAMTNNPTDFVIANNTDDAGSSNTNTRFAFLWYTRTGPIASTAPRQDVLITGNICRNSGYPVEIEGGLNGVTFRNNIFEDIWGASILGYESRLTWNVTWEGNEFIRCGYGEGIVHRVQYNRNTIFKGNIFNDCGTTGGGSGTLIQFSAGASAATSDNTDWIDNVVLGTLTTAISGSSSHTLTAANNLKRAYRNNGLTVNAAHFATTV